MLHVTQNRLLEKEFARECRHADDRVRARLRRVKISSVPRNAWDFRPFLKTVRGGYDGKGQWHVVSLDEAHRALEAANGAELIFERAVSLACELSVIATRNSHDEIVTYPVAENVTITAFWP